MFLLDLAAKVDRGLVRVTNQDVARVSPGLALAQVAEGMGGHENGEVASRAAVDALERSFEQMGAGGANPSEAEAHLLAAVLEGQEDRQAEEPPPTRPPGETTRSSVPPWLFAFLLTAMVALAALAYRWLS